MSLDFLRIFLDSQHSISKKNRERQQIAPVVCRWSSYIAVSTSVPCTSSPFSSKRHQYHMTHIHPHVLTSKRPMLSSIILYHSMVHSKKKKKTHLKPTIKELLTTGLLPLNNQLGWLLSRHKHIKSILEHLKGGSDLTKLNVAPHERFQIAQISNFPRYLVTC